MEEETKNLFLLLLLLWLIIVRRLSSFVVITRHTHRQISFSFDVRNIFILFFFFSGVHSSRHWHFLFYTNCNIHNQPLIQRETSHFDNVLSYMRQKRLAIYFSSSCFQPSFVRSFVRSLYIDDTDTIKNHSRRCGETTGLFDSHVINLSIWYFDCWSLLWRNQRRNHHHPSSSFIYMERLEGDLRVAPNRGSSVTAFTADDCAFFK